MCICLQHVGIQNISIKDYQIANISTPANDELGTIIYVHNKLTFDVINIPNAPLQISAIKLYFPDNNAITICNVYNQPNKNYNLRQLPNIINQFQQPMLLVL